MYKHSGRRYSMSSLIERTETVDTIEAATALKLDTVAKLMRRLQELGVTEGHLLRALSHSGVSRQLSAVLTQRKVSSPPRLSSADRKNLIEGILPGTYDGEGRTRSARIDVIYGDEREWLEKSEQVKVLLEELMPLQLQVALMRLGVNGSQSRTAQEVADQLCVTRTEVNRARGEAHRIMCAKAMELVLPCRRLGRFPSIR